MMINNSIGKPALHEVGQSIWEL